MRKPAALILVLALIALAGERQLVQFRLRQDPSQRLRVYCLGFDEEGMSIERLGTRKRERVAWNDIYEEDARQLRVRFKLELSEDERKGLIPGQEVFFRGGASVRGIVERKDEEKNEIYVRSDGMILAYPLDRLVRIEEVKIHETEAYDEEEIYVMRLQRRPPTTWGDHRRLADYLYELGNYEKALEHYRKAVELRPELQPKLESRMADVKAILEDEASLDVIQKAKSVAALWGRYKEAQSMLNTYAEANPGSSRRILRVVDEIENVRFRKLTSRYHLVKSRETDRAIRKYLLRKAPSLGEAQDWVKSALRQELMDRIVNRMGLSGEEFEAISKTKAPGATHWATYANGSFVIDPKAKRGQSTDTEIRGDPEDWWKGYGDVQSRSTWLRAYAAENLPELFEIVTIRETACGTCGGTGRVKHMSIRGLEALGGRHEWYQTCPRCFGARVDRGVGYK